MVSDFDAEADRRLIGGIASRSAESLARLYDRYAAIVYGLARRIVLTAEDAEEVVQDVFNQVWRDAARYEAARATVGGWLVMLTRTRAIDRLRAKRARPDLGAGADDRSATMSSQEPTPEQLSISAEQVTRVREALRTLPDTLQTLVELAYFEGLTHSEIAERTRLPLGTVKTRLRTAMSTLRGVPGVMSHERFAESLAAYALDALDHSERAEFEAHLASCAECRTELTELRRVTAAIGLGVEPQTPPAALRSRVLANLPASATSPEISARSTTSRTAWLVAAASLVLAAGAVLYALSLRAELRTVQEFAADAANRIETLRIELMQLRQDSSRLQRVVSIINAPDLRQARLAGSGPAEGATGLALWSQASGLVFNARRLPPVDPGRGYELWAILPGGKPISLGMVATSPDGTASLTAPVPPTVDVEIVAITIEQAGGSPTGQPQSSPVLLGRIGS